MNRSDYVAQATLTLSNKFHADKVNFPAFMYRLRAAILALNALDEVKKSLFYGRDFVVPPPNEASNEHDWRIALSHLSPDTTDAEHLLHGIIGLATEAGELLEAVQRSFDKEKQLDLVNVCEEVGDGKWYMAVIAKAAGFEWGQDEAVNIAKLRKRFPNAFTEHDANNRDLDAERKVLEGGDERVGVEAGPAVVARERRYFRGDNG